MALILYCEGTCNKQMGSLEPYIIKDDKYLCMNCGGISTAKSMVIEETVKIPQPTPYKYDSTEHKELYQLLITDGWIYYGHVSLSRLPKMDVFCHNINGKNFYVTIGLTDWAIRNDQGDVLQSNHQHKNSSRCVLGLKERYTEECFK